MENLQNQYIQPIPPSIPIPNNPKKTIVHQKFSPQEDEYLKQVVERIGTSDWAQVARAFNNSRTQRQCRERYKNYLAPGVVNGPWTDEEDQLLCQKYKAMGPQWVKIAKFFPGRTDINVKNRWVTKFKKTEAGLFNPNIQLEGVQPLSIPPQNLNYPEMKPMPNLAEISQNHNFLENKPLPNLADIPPAISQIPTINLIPSVSPSDVPIPPNPIESVSSDIDKEALPSELMMSSHLDEQK